MLRVNSATALGILLTVVAPASAGAQMLVRSPATSAPAASAPRPSSLPVIRMGSLPSIEARFPSWNRGRRIDAGGNWRGHGFGRGTSFGLRTGFLDATYWAQTVVPYQVPVYVPVPVPVYPQEYVPAPETPATPYDPTKSKMLTIGAGADGGAGVMRVEQVSDSVLRLTWLGSNRRIREARLFVADSAQRPLRTSLIDAATPSALFLIAPFASKVAYTGLTIVFADGATQTTLVPYPPTSVVKP
jgi:hypothetical protein